MKIVCIFTNELYAFQYDGEAHNEFERLMEKWTDVLFLRDFAKRNNVTNVDAFVQDRLQDAEDFQDRLDEITTKETPLSQFFVPYHDQEYSR